MTLGKPDKDLIKNRALDHRHSRSVFYYAKRFYLYLLRDNFETTAD
jgi:hypothetical protein